MSDEQFRIKSISAGSAARRAETEEPRPASAFRIQAGSSARLAEEEKRRGAEPRRGAPTLSLRASGGRMFRPEDVVAPTASGAGAVGTIPRISPSVDVPPDGSSSGHAAGTAGSLDPPSAVLPPNAVGRLQSMIRALFNPLKGTLD